MRQAGLRPGRASKLTWTIAYGHIWHGNDYVALGVVTNEPFRDRSYGLAVVSAATQYILDQGVAGYGAFCDNVVSLRLAHRLGFRFTFETITA